MRFLLKDIPVEDRPRERLEKYGPNVLSNYELLAIILRTGYKEVSVLDLSKDVLLKIEKLHKLSEITITELKGIKGIGKAKAIEIIAAIELGKRINTPLLNEIKLNSARATYLLVKEEMQNLSQEYFMCIYLNSKSEIIEKRILSIGTSNITIFHPRDILKWAIKLSASGIILVHNHPSGDPSPSNADIKVTKEIVNASKLVDIKIVDHIVIGKEKYYSFNESNIISNL
ncbi:MAG: DNA repair protein RadC [Bacilli bacterium]|nr:DNA repair protein RadC [Bacilli bacterium]